MAPMEGTVDTVAQAAHWQTAHHAGTSSKVLCFPSQSGCMSVDHG
jgi:hypothetical protein